MNNISSLMRELNALVESRTFTAEAAGGIAKGGAFDEINKRLLANRILREDIYHSNQVPIPTQHGGYLTASQSETKQRTVKDEQ